MITSLKIENFKGFCELELPQLSRITLLGGSNNVGKTSVLEACLSFFSRNNPQILLNQSLWRGIMSLPYDPETVWAPLFHDFNLAKSIVLTLELNNQSERLTIRYNPDYVSPVPFTQQPVNGTAPPIFDAQSNSIQWGTLDIIHHIENRPDQIMHLSLTSSGIQLAVENRSVSVYPIAYFGLSLPTDTNELARRFGQMDIAGIQDKALNSFKLSNHA